MATNLTRNRSFNGKGAMYIRERGAVNAAFYRVGNSDNLSFAINEERQTQRNFETRGGGNAAFQSSITDVTATINVLSVNPRIAAVALRALIATTTAVAITGEAQVGQPDSFLPFARQPDTDMTITITSNSGGTTHVVDTDYQIRNNGIFILETGNITAGLDLAITYTAKASYKIESLTRSSVEYEFYFDGFNEADNGKSVTVQCHRIQFSPTQALSLITEDFGALPMEFEVLSDDSKNGTTESQYFVVEMEQ